MVNETTKRWIILGSLLIVTLYLVWNAPDEESDTVEVVRATHHARVPSPVIRPMMEHTELPSGLRDRHQLNESKTIDLFGTAEFENTPEIVKKTEIKRREVKPRVPPLPFKYIGKLVEGGIVKVFLLEGGSLHTLSKGDKIDERYQLKQVNEQELTWLYLPMNITQKMNIGNTP